MLKDKKIGFKIAAGIGIMLAIITAVIGVTIFNLNGVKNSSEGISQVNIPLVKLAEESSTLTAEMMLEMRGYIYTADEKRIAVVDEKAAALGAKLSEAKAFGVDHKIPAESQKSIEDALATYNTYLEAKNSFKASMVKTTEVKVLLTKAVEVFYENVSGYEGDQDQSLNAELSKNASSTAIRSRVDKLLRINHIISNVNLARVYSNKGLEAKDPTYFDQSLAQFPIIYADIDKILANTSKQLNKDQMNNIKVAAQTYESNIKNIKALMEEQLKLQVILLDTGNQLVTYSAAVLTSALELAANEGLNNTKSVGFTNIFLISGFVIALLLGVGINFNVIKGITAGINRVTVAAGEIAIGNTNFDLVAQGNDEIGQLTEAFNTMKENITVQAIVVKQIADGNTDIEVNVLSEKDTLNMSLKVAIENINAIIHELSKIINSVKQGDLSARGDSSKFEGSWAEMINGLNDLINAFADPIDITNRYVTQLGNGEIPPKITKEYYGDFNNIKVNLNQCIEAINRLVEDTNQLIQAALDGKLDTRANESHHQGEYREIVKGINRTLDAIIEPVNEAAQVLDEFSRGNLTASVKGNYKGDHAAIKNALNSTITSISGYIVETSQILNQMADGNLDLQITSDFKGDFVAMKNAINNIIDSLNEVLGEINMASDQVATGSRQVAQSSQALSHGSTIQASSIEEITASMTEISEQTKENAINASKANEFSNNAKDAAAKGNQQMVEMVSAMRDINDSSSNISKIISVIDEIAFQTNILALNAAVEAARAGQHGKGFAVVAEEVRNLAARSANAAKETTVMIENSVIKVGKGMNIAEDTAKALEGIVDGVSKAADLVADIAYASNEQATAISQINEGIFQVSQVTQNNTATAEESAAASEEMTSQAQMLKEMVSKFRLKRGSRQQMARGYSASPAYSKPSAPSYSNHSSSGDQFSISLDDDEFGKY